MEDYVYISVGPFVMTSSIIKVAKPKMKMGKISVSCRYSVLEIGSSPEAIHEDMVCSHEEDVLSYTTSHDRIIVGTVRTF